MAGYEATETDDSIEDRKVRVKKGSRQGSAKRMSCMTPSKKRRSGQVKFNQVEDDARKSRHHHESIDQSALYLTFKGTTLDRTRANFQTMMFAQDGFHVKVHSQHKEINYLLILEAARSVYGEREYKIVHPACLWGPTRLSPFVSGTIFSDYFSPVSYLYVSSLYLYLSWIYLHVSSLYRFLSWIYLYLSDCIYLKCSAASCLAR